MNKDEQFTSITGDQIRMIRDKLGLTQKGIADRIGVSSRRISLLENNKRKISETELEKLILLQQELDPSEFIIRRSKYIFKFIPRKQTWINWEIRQKAAYLTILSMFILTPLFGFAAYLYSLGQKTNMVVDVLEGDNCILQFKNTGETTIDIDVIDWDIWHTVIFVTSDSLNSNVLDFLDQYSQTVGTDEIIKITEVRELRLSPGESIKRKLVSQISNEGSVASYDIRFEFQCQPVSKIEKIAYNLLKRYDLVVPKTEIFVRFNGCEFLQISAQNLNKRSTPLENEIADNELMRCIEKTNPDVAEKIKAIELNTQEILGNVREMINSWPNEKIFSFITYLLDRIPEKNGSEQIRLCEILWLSFTILEIRGINYDHGFESLDDLIIHLTAIDILFE